MKSNSQHIKFGIICEDEGLFTWQKAVIEKLVSQSDIELKLVISHKGIRKKSNFLWNLRYKNVAREKADNLFKELSIMHCIVPENEQEEIQLKEADMRKIADIQLDFLLSFSNLSLSGKILSLPKYGVWAYQFGSLKSSVSAPCFWEIYRGDFVTSAYLVRLMHASDDASILHQGHLKTTVSYKKNLNKVIQECISWPLKVCVDIRNLDEDKGNASTVITKSKLGSTPNGLQTLLFPFIQLKQLIKRGFKQVFFTDYWNIGVVAVPIQEFLKPDKKHVVKWFPNLPKSRFMADPFGIYWKDELHIVYEDLAFDDGLGKTASFLFDDDKFKHNKIVIAEQFHMSYPFLLEHEGEVYCMPETYQANEVRLYKALKFPEKWALEKVLIDNYAGVDSTLFKQDDTWFLFSTDKNAGPHHNLNIHYASDIFGPWMAHPKNPVKTDIRSARPAGTLFENEGELFRPSMDYSEKIEGRITLNKVTTLSKYDFSEEVHHVIQPFQDSYFSDKVHTLSKVGDFTLVDGAKELFIFKNFKAFKFKMKRVLQKLRSK